MNKSSFNLRNKLTASFIFLLLIFGFLKNAVAEGIAVNIGEVSKTELTGWDEGNSEINLILELVSKSDDLKTCGVSFKSATTDIDEALKPKSNFRNRNGLLLNQLKPISGSKIQSVNISYPSKNAKTVTFSGSVCTFSPSETKEQPLVIKNIFQRANKPLDVALLKDASISLAFFDAEGIKGVQKASYAIYTKIDDKADQRDAYIKEFGRETGDFLWKYYDGGYNEISNLGSVYILGLGEPIVIFGLGELNRIAEISLTRSDGTSLKSSTSAIGEAGNQLKVHSIAYMSAYLEKPPRDSQLTLHLVNTGDIKEIPFTLTFEIP